MAYQSFDTPFMNEGYMQDEIIRQKGVPIPKVDPKKKRKPYSKSGSPEILDRIGPLGVQSRQMKNSDQPPIVITPNPKGVGYGPQGNRFGNSPAANQMLDLSYGGRGSVNAIQAIEDSPGRVDAYLQMAREVEQREAMKPMNQRNQPPQKQVSLGQLLGK